MTKRLIIFAVLLAIALLPYGPVASEMVTVAGVSQTTMGDCSMSDDDMGQDKQQPCAMDCCLLRCAASSFLYVVAPSVPLYTLAQSSDFQPDLSVRPGISAAPPFRPPRS